jgi:glycosyltransferase involved in cell wall biosynthesis
MQSWFHYLAFNRLILKAATEWHEEVHFDLCHQVTVAAWRVPSPLWKMPIPFVWGPIGGAGNMPHAFRSMLSPSARLFEWLRDVQTYVAQRSHSFRECMAHTTVVLAANQETETFLKPYRKNLPLLRLHVVSITPEKILKFQKNERHVDEDDDRLMLFAGGNMIGSKGLYIAIYAIQRALQKGIRLHYTIAGGGPEIKAMMRLTRKLGLEKHISFHPGYEGDAYVAALQRADIYFLPSFRETMPLTLVESYLAGCYPVVAQISGQGEVVSLAGGRSVPVISMRQMIEELATQLKWCAENRAELDSLNQRAISILVDHYNEQRYQEIIDQAYTLATTPSASCI